MTVARRGAVTAIIGLGILGGEEKIEEIHLYNL